MSARHSKTLTSNAATVDHSSWNGWLSEDTFQSLMEPFSFADNFMAIANPALRVPVAPGAPDTMQLTSTVHLTDTIDPAGDSDVHELSVVAGQTYMISVRGSGSDPLDNSVINLLDNTSAQVGTDDDGGSGTNSLLTFTATYTGSYFIEVEAFPDSGLTGEYTLDVVEQPATDVVPSTHENAVLINPGVTFGFIDSPVPDVPLYADLGLGETDAYKFTLEAGKVYTIEVAGGYDYTSDHTNLPPGEIDPWIFLYGPDQSLVGVNDDISFPSDDSSRITFVAEESGTYYLDVQSYAPWTGGYSITLGEVNPADHNPLDAINWFSADNIDVGPGNVAKVYFALPGESFGLPGDNGTDPMPSFGWNAFEKQQVFNALMEFTKITGITYVETNNATEAEFRLITTTSNNFGAAFFPQDPAFGDFQGIGAFNVDSGAWNFEQQQSLVKGGFAYNVILHEFGHAHGLAHPHDNGGGSEIMLGVNSDSDLGVYNLNQGVYTVMSYNEGWALHPDGYGDIQIDNGWSGTLSALDIAVLQERYGVHAHATGNDVYQLKDVKAQGTYYETIWDTGGTDEIRYSGLRNAQIDLTAATLDYSPTGGGVVSFVNDIQAGYTIANGVVIEKATGGDGNDILIGNAVANVLTGNGGDDVLMGRAGGDTLSGGSGFDTASYRLATSGISALLSGSGGSASGGEATGDSFSSIEKLEGSEFADALASAAGGHTLSGLGGNDSLSGGNDNDILDGGAGNDNLSGGNHDDTLNGGDGNDNLSGGDGNDILNGGAGNDLMSGGNNNDIFAFTEIGGTDRITDFLRGPDKIDLSAIDAVAGGADNAFTFIGASAFSGVAGQLRSYSQGADKFIAADVNGDSLADFTIQTNIQIISTDLVL